MENSENRGQNDLRRTETDTLEWKQSPAQQAIKDLFQPKSKILSSELSLYIPTLKRRKKKWQWNTLQAENFRVGSYPVDTGRNDE